MGFLDRLLGRLSGQPQAGYGQNQAGYGQPPAGYGQPQAGYGTPPAGSPPPSPPWAGQGSAHSTPGAPGQAPTTADQDAQAIARYQYLLRTAPPDQLEKAHKEAFEALTPQQRQQVLQQLATANPNEAPANDSPEALARAATRQEMRSPGSLSRTFGGGGMGRMAGIGIGGALLGSVAGAVIGSSIAHEMFDGDGFIDWNTDAGMDSAAGFGDTGGDFGGGFGGDFGGFGGDF